MASTLRAQARQTRHAPVRHSTDDRALAYPEPPPHPNWSKRPRYDQLTPKEQQRNRELLLRSLRTDHTLTEAN